MAIMKVTDGFVRPRKGRFIVIEGIDGAGKSTISRMLINHMELSSEPVRYHHEPSGGTIGRLITDKFLSGEEQIGASALALLFAADRMDDINNFDDGLLKELETRSIVCDRFYLSQIAYQSHVYVEHDNSIKDNAEYNKSLQWNMILNEPAHDLLIPDIYIYLDCKPEVAFERIQKRNEAISIMESNVDRLKRIYTAYRDAIKLVQEKWFDNILVVDANDDIAKVYNRVKSIIDKGV